MSILSAAEIIGGIESITAVDEKILLLQLSVEAFVKRVTGRGFEQANYAKFYSIKSGQPEILLDDFPVTEFASLEYVTNRNTDGSVTLAEYEKNTYVVDLDAGIVTSLSGPFKAGPQAVKATYTAGYTSTQISENSADEIRILKALCLSILAREYGLAKDDKRHLRSISFGDESSSYWAGLDKYQREMIDILKKRGRQI